VTFDEFKRRGRVESSRRLHTLQALLPASTLGRMAIVPIAVIVCWFVGVAVATALSVVGVETDVGVDSAWGHYAVEILLGMLGLVALQIVGIVVSILPRPWG